jgi:hypothetical protein
MIDGAINIDEAIYFTIRDSYFAWLKGRALRCGRSTVLRVDNTWMHKIGDIGKSPIELDGSSLNTAIDKPIMNVTGAVGQPIHVTVNSHGFSTGDEMDHYGNQCR